MKIGYLIKVRPDLEDIVPEDVEEYVQVSVGENGLYSDEDLEKVKDVDFKFLSTAFVALLQLVLKK